VLLTRAGALSLAPSAGPGGAPRVDDPDPVIVAASREVSWNGETLSGDGGEHLLQAAARSRFLIVIESHNDHVTPLLTASMFEHLRRHAGFNHAAIEQDPWGMEIASAATNRGRLDRIVDAARRHPFSFTFNTDEELELLARIGKASTASDQPIWGVDQLHGAAGPLGELAGLLGSSALGQMPGAARSAECRKREDGLRDPDGHFLAPNAEVVSRHIASVRSQLSGPPDERAEALLEWLESSARIYALYATPGTGHQSNREREAWMKRSFMERYRRARTPAAPHPKVLVKAGYWHAIRGRGPGNVFTLGGFLHELAIAEGGRALTVQVLPLREWWPTYDSIDPEYRILLSRESMDRSTLVSLEPLRGPFHSGRRFGLPTGAHAAFAELVFGVDYVLFTPSRPGSYERTRSSGC